jgi:hypothetical protein
MSNKKIFRSCFFLSFENKILELDFEKKKNKKFTKYVHLQLGILLLIAIALVTVISIYIFPLYSTLSHYKLIIISSYICLFLITCSFVVSIFFRRKINFMKLMYYISFTLISLIFLDFRFTMNRILNISLINWYIAILELSYRLVITIIFMLSFIENLFINLTIVVLEWVIYTHTVPTEIKSSWITNHIFFSVAFGFFTVLGYVIDRRLRVSYYYRFQANRNSLWLKGVLENMNEGFLSMKNNHISYINPYLVKILDDILPKSQQLQSPRLTDGIILNLFFYKNICSSIRF